MDRLERNAQFTRALLDLRALILEGAFEPNTRLPETHLAERLGLSRTPLRQAMDRLELSIPLVMLFGGWYSCDGVTNSRTGA